MKTKKILFIGIIVIVFSANAGCEKDTFYNKLIGSWKFIGFGNIEDNSFENATPTDCGNCYILSFSSDGILSGTTSMNSFNGEYEVHENNGITLFNIISTLAGELGNGDKYADALWIIESYEIDNKELKLYYNNKKNFLLLKYIK